MISCIRIYILQLNRHPKTPHQGAAKHKDPFDRIILSQAKADSLMLLTQDEKLLGYEEDCIYRVG